MADYLKHGEYLGSVEFSAEDSILHGRIIGINDLVTYEAGSVVELQEVFNDAIEDYLITCKELEKEPDKFFKGVLK